MLLTSVLLFLTCPPSTTAQQPPQYERRELSIPVRDGIRLFAVALIPKDQTSPLPIMLIRTPFNAAREFAGPALPVAYRELAEYGYIFVTEDTRGRNGSQGKF